jgi:hypothetical protein
MEVAMQQGREIMRVLRDEASGGIVIEVQGRAYNNIREITDGRVGRTVLQAIADLVKFTGGLVRLPAEKPGSSPPPPAVPPPAPSVTPQEQVEEEFLRRVATGGVGLGGGVSSPAVSPTLPSSSPGSFVREINDIFQRYLQKAGLKGEPTNMVMADIHGGLRIKIGADYFSSPDEVTDPTIQQMIKAAVKEWEQR